MSEPPNEEEDAMRKMWEAGRNARDGDYRPDPRSDILEHRQAYWRGYQGEPL